MLARALADPAYWKDVGSRVHPGIINALAQALDSGGPPPSGGPEWEAMVRRREALDAAPQAPWKQNITDGLEKYIQRMNQR